MIVLDTNVVSELMKPSPLRDEKVFGWVAAMDARTFWIASVTYAEILSGIEVLPKGRRRSDLMEQAVAVVERDLDGRVLPFDAAAARVFGRLSGERRLAGLRSSKPDLLIAATALSHDFAVATRDVHGFGFGDLRVINPWDDPAP